MRRVKISYTCATFLTVQIGAVDPATQLASREVPWILLPNWQADRSVDPDTQLASR
jgi:hypothetical protein